MGQGQVPTARELEEFCRSVSGQPLGAADAEGDAADDERGWKERAFAPIVSAALEDFYESKRPDLVVRLTGIVETFYARQGDDIEQRLGRMLSDYVDTNNERIADVIAASARKTIDENLEGWLDQTLQNARRGVGFGILAYIGGFASVSAIYWLLKFLVDS